MRLSVVFKNYKIYPFLQINEAKELVNKINAGHTVYELKQEFINIDHGFPMYLVVKVHPESHLIEVFDKDGGFSMGILPEGKKLTDFFNEVKEVANC